jgi:hypothetical protein
MLLMLMALLSLNSPLLVVDQNSGMPIENLQISDRDFTLYTFTDEDGFFDFSVFASLNPSDSLYFSHTAYQTRVFAIADLAGKTKILMRGRAYMSDLTVIESDRVKLTNEIVPIAKEYISSVDIQMADKVDLKSVYEVVSSVKVERNSNLGSYISIRGSNSEDVTVLYDGIALNHINSLSTSDIGTISLSNVSKIEFSKSGNLIHEGAGAAYGVVNIRSFDSDTFTVNLDYASISGLSEYMSANMTLPYDDNRLHLSATRQNSNTDYYTLNNLTNSSDEESMTMDRFGESYEANYERDLGAGLFQLKYMNGFQTSLNSSNQIKDKYDLLSGRYDGSVLGIEDFNLQLYTINSLNQFTRVADNRASYEFNYDTRITHFRMGKKSEFKRFYLETTYTFFHNELNRLSNFILDNVHIPIFRGLSYENMHSLATTVGIFETTPIFDYYYPHFFVSARYDHLTNGDKNWTNNFGMSIKRKNKDREIEFFLLNGKNIRYPSLYENAFSRDVVLSTISNGSDDQNRLLPNDIKSFEIGVNYNYLISHSLKKRISFHFSYFYITKENLVVIEPLNLVPIQVQNGTDNGRGFDGSLKYSNFMEALDLVLNGYYAEHSNQFSYAYKPNSLFKFIVKSRYFEDIILSSEFYYEGQARYWTFEDGFTEQKAKNIASFYDINARVSYLLNSNGVSLRLGAAINNILDNNTGVFSDVKGRQLSVSVGFAY